ncbi:MAG: hypothetical protein CM1200mP6_03630 [Anaerolineaceae bacterium]|nr:MAG: hypothetical protein CM1200mP6_03630 [Anaerolineaceae bacterium]
MTRIVRSALLQSAYTGDKQTMIDKHVNYVEQAASQGAQIMCFQELFYSPYFCQVQDVKYYSWAEQVPDGPTTTLMQEIAAKHKIVLVVPLYEEEDFGIYYNTGVVIDSDGTFLGNIARLTCRIYQDSGKSSIFDLGKTGYPVFETSVGRVGVYICYDRHFPEGARMLGLNGAEIVFIPSATSHGLSNICGK